MNTLDKLEEIRKKLEFSPKIDDASFSKIRLKDYTIPEVDYDSIDLSTEFLGKKLKIPLVILGWTGGSEYVKQINEILAETAERMGIGFGCGSQYAAIENPGIQSSFTVIKDLAPNVLKIANVSATHLKKDNFGAEELNKCIDMIDADAIALYFDTLQEVLKPEGEKNFKGLLEKIKESIPHVKKPIIVKGYGDGITRMDAIALHDIGIKYIDISGYAGPNKYVIEEYNLYKDSYDFSRNIAEVFQKWGTSTVRSILNVSGIYDNSQVKIIASGGIRTGINIAKCICLGANIAGVASPFLKTAEKDIENGKGPLISIRLIKTFLEELKIAMFVSGSEKISDLTVDKIEYF